MKKGQMLYLPPDYHFTYVSNENSEMLIMRLSSKVQLCESYMLDRLVHETSNVLNNRDLRASRKSPFLLDMNQLIQQYASNLVACLENGIRCKGYFEVKTKELFYLLRSFYQKEDLALFFEKALSYDTGFSHFIQQNYYKFQTLSEMAMAMNMTLSGFEKRFKKVFKTSGYRWMNEHKAKKIHHAICTEDTPLKEISMRFGFSSQSTFNDFCKKKLGFTPGQIRKNINGQK
jgi:AraC-like DNA-binding protein